MVRLSIRNGKLGAGWLTCEEGKNLLATGFYDGEKIDSETQKVRHEFLRGYHRAQLGSRQTASTKLSFVPKIRGAQLHFPLASVEHEMISVVKISRHPRLVFVLCLTGKAVDKTVFLP